MTAWFSMISTSVKLWCTYTSFKGHHIQGTLLPRTFEASLFSRVVKESPHPRVSDGLLGVCTPEEPLYPRATGRPSYCRVLQGPLYSIYTPMKGSCIHLQPYVVSKGRCIHVLSKGLCIHLPLNSYCIHVPSNGRCIHVSWNGRCIHVSSNG